MSDLILSPALSTKAVAVRNALSGLGNIVELRPETTALVEQGLRVQTMLNAIAPDLEIADVLEIDSADMLAEAEQLNGRIAALCADSGAIERERQALTAPFLDIKKTLDAGYNELREYVGGFKARLSAKILAYNAEQKRIRAAAEAEARAKQERDAEEAREKQRAADAEAARLLREAQAQMDAGQETEALQTASRAGDVAETGRQALAQAEIVAHTRPLFAAAGGSAKGVRETWKAELSDFDKLVCHVADRIRAGDRSCTGLLALNESAANAKAKVEKTGFNVPGLRATCADALSVRKQAVAA